MKLAAYVVAVLLLVAVAAFLWYRFNGGVSHQDICNAVHDEAKGLHEHVELRYHDLDRKLDGIESKLDQLIKMVQPPASDCTREAR